MTGNKAKRVIFIGLDGLIPEMVEKFTAEGNMPNVARLMRGGTYSPMYSSPPVDTPTNWTSLATGAWTGTHGLNSFGIHDPGEPYEAAKGVGPNIFPPFANIAPHNLNQLSRAEYIWQAAERAGKKCILVNYPGGWPPNLKNGITMDGSGPYSSVLARLSYPASYATKEAGASEHSVRLELEPAVGWRNPPPSQATPLEGSLLIAGEVGVKVSGGAWQLGDSEGAATSAGVVYPVLLVATSAAGYDTLYLFRSRNASSPLAVLQPGEWSAWLYDDFQTEYGKVKAQFRVRLTSLSRDGQGVRIDRSAIFNPTGWAYPAEIATELIEDAWRHEDATKTLPAGVDGSDSLVHSLTALCQVYESIADQAVGIARSACYLGQKYPWDLLFAQIHAPDGLNHEALNGIFPEWPLYDPVKGESYWDKFRREYRVLDNMVGEIVRTLADEETLVVMVSDHAAIPTLKTVWPVKAMVEAGLMAFQDDGQGRQVLDWSRTKVVLGAHPMENLWVNLKGRDPQGIVEPGEEYERVRSEAIKVLYSLRDPENGQCPITLALRKEEAAFMGQWGDHIGDVVYYYTPGYAEQLNISSIEPIDPGLVPETGFTPVGEGMPTKYGAMQGMHHPYLPTAKYGGCSVQGVFIMAGPGVKKGHRLSVPPWTVDVTPTICHLAGLPRPQQSEGKVISELKDSGLLAPAATD